MAYGRAARFLDDFIRALARHVDDLRGAVANALRNARSSEQPGVAASGTQNLLAQPEFHDVRKLRSILRIVEEQKTLYDLVADTMPSSCLFFNRRTPSSTVTRDTSKMFFAEARLASIRGG